MHGQEGSATNSCPFDPTPGQLPPCLAGREEEQRSIAQYIQCLQHDEQTPFAAVVFGPRGNGKTALLEWAQRLALEKGVPTISVEASMIESEDAVIREQSAGSRWSSILERVRAFGGRLGLNTPLEEALGRRLRRHPLLLLIDEAHTLDIGVGRKLVQAARRVNRKGGGGGILLLIAGTPDLPSHLRKLASTFWERCPIFPIARLDESSAADAIRIPLEVTDRPISGEALEQAVQESLGYPFFLQLWGRALWHTAETRGKVHRNRRRIPRSGRIRRVEGLVLRTPVRRASRPAAGQSGGSFGRGLWSPRRTLRIRGCWSPEGGLGWREPAIKSRRHHESDQEAPQPQLYLVAWRKTRQPVLLRRPEPDDVRSENRLDLGRHACLNPSCRTDSCNAFERERGSGMCKCTERGSPPSVLSGRTETVRWRLSPRAKLYQSIGKTQLEAELVCKKSGHNSTLRTDSWSLLRLIPDHGKTL